MKRISGLILLLSCLALAGCATNPASIQGPPDGKGRIVGQDAGFLASLNPLGTTTSINIHKVDGAGTGNGWDYPTVVDLDPGKHTLEVWCFGSQDNALAFRSVQTISIDVKAGATYYLKPTYPSGSQCSVNVEQHYTGSAQ